MSAVVVAGPSGHRPPARAPLPEAIDFQGDVTAIELQRVPRWARSTVLLVSAALGTALLWSAYAPLDKIVRAGGKLVTTEPKLVIAPFETAVIRSIEVKPGDIVHSGQVVAQLDPTFAAADTATVRHKLSQSMAEIARLQAELDGTDYHAPDDSPEAKRETILFQQRQAERSARLKVFDKQSAEIQADMQSNGSDLAFTQKRLGLAREIEDMRSELWKQQNNSKLQLLDANAQRLQLEQGLAGTSNQKRELDQKLASVAASRAAYEREWVRTVAEALSRAEEARDGAQEELSKAERRRALVDLRAPEDGVVLDVNEHYSRGSIAQGATPVVTLVPLNAQLEVEAAVEAGDVGEIRVGDPVRIKLEAFPFQRHGVLEGVVRTITDDAFSPNQSQGPGPEQAPRLIYRTRIALTETKLRDVRSDLRLLPGMSLAAEIKVGQRTVLSYVLYPIIRVLDESLREP